MSQADDLRTHAAAIIAIADAMDAGTPAVGTVTFPQNNYVFHRSVAGPVSFTATKSGNGTFRLKQGATVIAENATGVFTAPLGWYSLCLVEGGVEGAAIGFGVGYHYIAWGQSNAVSQASLGDAGPPVVEADPPVPATIAHSCIIGILAADGLSVQYKDANAENVTTGLAWIHMVNKLRTFANRDVPYCVTVCAEGATTIQSWAAAPYLTRLVNAMGLVKPGMVFTVQGESNPELGWNQSIYDCLATMFLAANAARQVPWIVNLDDHANTNSGYYSIALAQKALVDNYSNTYWGIDFSVMHCPDTLPYTINRQPNEVHFSPARKKVVGETLALRIIDVAGLNV